MGGKAVGDDDRPGPAGNAGIDWAPQGFSVP
jgi:hypothetical protein